MEIDCMYKMVNDLLNSNKEIRESAEGLLQRLREECPHKLIINFIVLIKEDTGDNMKSLAAVLLKQVIPQRWSVIDNNSKVIIKKLLLELLTMVPDWSLIKKICDIVADLAITIFRAEVRENWINFISFIFHSLASSNNYQVFAGFKILTSLLPFYSDDFSNYHELLYQSFSKHIENPEKEVAAGAVQALTSLISVINTPETMYFTELLRPLLKSVLSLSSCSSNLAEESIKNLRDLAETEPFYFKSQLAWCFASGQTLCKQSVMIGCKYIFLEFLVVLLEKHKASLWTKKEILSQTCELLKSNIRESMHMFEDSIEINYESLFQQLLRRIIDAIGESITDYLLKSSILALSNNEWEVQYISLSTLIQIIPEIYTTDHLNILFSAMHTFIVSPHQKMRKACCNAIICLCVAFPKDFQRRFYQGILPLITQGLCDQSPDVINESCKACKLFIEDCEGQIVRKYIGDCAQILIKLLNENKTSCKALELIQSFAYICKSSMKSLFPELFVSIQIVMQRTHNNEIITAAIDCLLALRKTVKMSEFLVYLPNYLAILQTTSETSRSTNFDNLHILNAWKLLSQYLRSELTPYLSEIIPLLLQGITKSDSSELDEYLEALLSIIESTNGGYLLYIDRTSELVLPLLHPGVSESTRVLASNICGGLVSAIRDSGNKDYCAAIVIYARTFLSAIWKVCSQETDLQTLVEMLGSVRVLIEGPGYEFLTDTEVSGMGEIVLKLLQDQASLSAGSEELILQQDYLKKTVADILSALFKSHKGLSMGILEYVYSNIIGKFLNSSSNDTDRIFALIIITDIIDCVGQILHPSKLKELAEVLIYYAGHSNEKIRYVAVGGIIAICTKINNENFGLLLESILTVLDKCINSFDDRKKSVKKVREFAVIAVGKLVKFQWKNLMLEVVLPWWVNYLPVEIHKEQAKETHDFLADLVINEANFMAESVVVVNLFVGIAFTEYCSDTTLPKITKVLEMYVEAKNQQSLMSCLSPGNRNKVSRLILS